MIYNDGTYEEEDSVWFVGNTDNCLYCMDKNGYTSLVTMLPVEGNTNDTFRQNPMCIKDGHCVVCLPDRAKKIYIYNLLDKCMDEISMPSDTQRLGIYNAWIYNGEIWCITYKTGELFRCSVQNRCVNRVYKIYDNSEFSSGEAIMNGRYLYFVTKVKGEITEFDMYTEKIKRYELLCDEGFGTIKADGDIFYLTGYKKSIYVWNRADNSVKVIDFEDKMHFKKELTGIKYTRFFQSRIIDQYVLVIPHNNNIYISDDVVVYDRNNNSVNVYNLRYKDEERLPEEYLVYNYSCNNHAVIQDCKRNRFINLNLETGDVSYIEMHVDKKMNNSQWKEKRIYGLCCENSFLTLDDFLSSIR